MLSVQLKRTPRAVIASLHETSPKSDILELRSYLIMGWFTPKKISDNELGEYLPDEEAQLQEGSEPIQAKNDREAQEKCQEVAAQYGGVEANAEPTDRNNEYDCRFKFWVNYE